MLPTVAELFERFRDAGDVGREVVLLPASEGPLEDERARVWVDSSSDDSTSAGGSALGRLMEDLERKEESVERVC